MGLESISEPDIDLPDDDEDEENEDDEDNDEFSDAQDHTSDSPDLSRPSSRSKGEDGEGDTEDDPADPLTPGAGRSSFVNIIPPELMQKSLSLSTSASTSVTGSTGMSRTSSGVDSLSFDDEDEVEWVGHEREYGREEDMLTPQQEYMTNTPMQPPLAESQATIGPRAAHTEVQAGEQGLKHARGGISKRKANKKKHGSGQGRGGEAPMQQYPFPATAAADDDEEVVVSAPDSLRRIPQMRTAKARDGGRTQSGGVKGVPVDDLDDD